MVTLHREVLELRVTPDVSYHTHQPDLAHRRHSRPSYPGHLGAGAGSARPVSPFPLPAAAVGGQTQEGRTHSMYA